MTVNDHPARRTGLWIGRGGPLIFPVVALGVSPIGLAFADSDALRWTVAAVIVGGCWAALILRVRAAGLFRIRPFRSRAPRHAPATPRRKYLVPRDLPPAMRSFVGRAEEIRLVTEYLTDLPAGNPRLSTGPRLVVIQGAAGIGKTAMAIRVARQLAARYPGGQLFANLRPAALAGVAGESLDPVDQVRYEVLGGFVQALKQPGEQVPQTLDGRVRRYQEMTRAQRVLIVLDDVDSPELVRSVLPAGPGCAVLITSRRSLPRLSPPDLSPPPLSIELPALRKAEVIELLREIVGADRIDAEPDEAAKIVAVTGGHPLSVQIAAAALAARPHSTLAGATRQVATDGLPDRPLGQGPYADALDLVYAMLTQEEQAALPLLALVNRDRFRAWMLAALANVDERAALRIADRLVTVGLVERTSEDSAGVPVFSVPEHVFEYAAARLAKTVSKADQEARVARLQRHRQSRQQSRPTGELNEKVYTPLVEGRLFEALSGAREAVALARDSVDGLTEGVALASFAEVRAELGSHEAAEDLANAALRPEVATELSRARAYRCLGRLRRRAHQRDAAWEFLQLAWAAAQAADDTSEEIRILRELAVVQAVSATPMAALDIIGRARILCASRPGGGLPHLAGLGWAQSVVHQALDEMPAAWACLDEAQRSAEEGGQRLWQAWIGHRRSLVYLEARKYDQARRYAFDALDLFSAMNHRYGKAHCRRVVGLAHLAQGRAAEASRALAEALENFVNCGDRWIEADTATKLADAYLRQDERLAEARRLLRAASGTFVDLGDTASFTVIQGMLARCVDVAEPVAGGKPAAVPAGWRG